jgi:hypothetical protein
MLARRLTNERSIFLSGVRSSDNTRRSLAFHRLCLFLVLCKRRGRKSERCGSSTLNIYIGIPDLNRFLFGTKDSVYLRIYSLHSYTPRCRFILLVFF